MHIVYCRRNSTYTRGNDLKLNNHRGGAYTELRVKLAGIVAMRYVAAYLLAVLGGNENPSAADIKKILSSVGIDAEDDKLKKVISELNGKNIQDLIAEGPTTFLLLSF